MSEKFSKKKQQKEKLLPDYLEEAKKIEEELDSMEDPWADDDEIEEKMRLRIYQGILEEQEKRRKKVSWVHRAGKYVAMVAITVIAIFSVSMTSQANRQRFLRSVSYIVGRNEVVEISNTDNLDSDDMEEEQALAEVEEKLSCEQPVFMYRPKKFELKTYIIYDEAGIALIEYKYQDQIMFLYISKNENELISNTFYQGDIKEKFNVSTDQINIEVTKREDKGDERPAYDGRWIYNNCYYSISGKIDKEEFVTFLKNIRF
ncbi:Uncharacterised protein [Blautia hydrogenotrophica]|uniref:DUF4367 domain-containing protein n=1 Tax=Blautia hydrogenotrophica TaxID=53443 RepID=UPI0006C2491E|nr:DUF4367 domain-containing protein [Blautia hydrogenotrophica]CUM83978.1 Uncharacterised protein [Blautia hydrogenotrophica]SCH30726.1 Uncharacterised protein [uncultured Blautia sp.]